MLKVRGWAAPGKHGAHVLEPNFLRLSLKLTNSAAGARRRSALLRSPPLCSALSVRSVQSEVAGSGLAPAACQLSPGPLRYICLNERLRAREHSSAREGGRRERERGRRRRRRKESFPF